MDPVITVALITGIISFLTSITTCVYHVVTAQARTTHEAGLVITKEVDVEQCPSVELDNKLKNPEHKDDHHKGKVMHDKTTITFNFSDTQDLKFQDYMKKQGGNGEQKTALTPTTKDNTPKQELEAKQGGSGNELLIPGMFNQQTHIKDFSHDITDPRDVVLELTKLALDDGCHYHTDNLKVTGDHSSLNEA
ncbi:hypothetical protein Trichorick_00212 [Candidatus Trichorickettsia mobilis]|uniref:Uncharacterized protein n=1 Tax=Candidatus Trichorickettsia mobilis TaxID=1346319 RepID=A0ABZ0UT08_9RICK|nr:hypothetical protein [Candidatus Trichorickettsia mobilis]WPY00340.1 hypothetical protein Trichorick_00212 [Candidatus Trichorickettsia mobilis]